MHGPILALLTFLFALRVFGQLVVAFFDVTWLPTMEHWFSGLIPYPSLLTIQVLMLILMIKITGDVWRHTGAFGAPRPHWRGFLIKFAAVYSGLMALRYVITMLLHPEMRWFGRTIPIFFHFVLAAYICVLGDFHRHPR